MRRSGVIARKLGMTTIYDEVSLRAIPVTVLEVDCQVVNVKTQQQEGYDAVVVKFGEAKLKQVKKPVKGQYSKFGIAPGIKKKEFRVDSNETRLSSGQQMKADYFQVNSFVDVQGTTKGKGFQGVMKRYNFSGLRASHGVSLTHRSGGSTGQCQDPGKVNKGKKMPGQMGNTTTTIQNLKIVSIDSDRSLLFVKGAVPGSENGLVFVRDAVKKGILA
jgi:large subunit ribosomal protein L3